MDSQYPVGTAQALLASEHVSQVTRERITARLQPPIAPQFFAPAEYAVLEAVCARLVPQDDRTQRIPIAPFIDFRLQGGMANGWRYDTMPTDSEAYRRGLQGIEETSRARYGKSFGACDAHEQDALLADVQRGAVAGGAWEQVVPRRFFEEMLSEVAEIYYAHPDAQDEIGYTGFADVPNWSKIGLNEHEAREPLPLMEDSTNRPQ